MSASNRPADSYVQVLQSILGTLGSDDRPETIEENRALLEWSAKPLRVITMLQQILDEPRVLEEIAERSYRHVNHFDKIVVIGGSDPKAYRLTLHLWWPTPPGEAQPELIHAHRFNFWSSVLLGEVRSENFERRAEGPGTRLREYRYVPELRGQSFRDFYEFCGETYLVRNGQYRKSAGVTYYLSAPCIHRISLPETITCSLVLRGPRLRPYSNVFNSEYPGEDTAIPNEMFSPETLATKLTLLRAALVAQHAQRKVAAPQLASVEVP